MPVRSKGQLLAGAGALIALCVAGSGCNSARTAARPVVATPPAVASAAPAAKPRFVFFRRANQIDVAARLAENRDDAIHGRAIIASTWQTADRGAAVRAYVPAPPAEPAHAVVQQTSAVEVTSSYAPNASPSASPTPWRAVADGTEKPAATKPQGEAIGAPADLAPNPRVLPQAMPTVHHYPSGLGNPAPVVATPAAPREFEMQSLPPYRVEPPDILLIRASSAVTLPTQELNNQHLVRPDGTINLGIYGSVYVAGMTLDEIRDVVANILKERRPKRKNDDGKVTDEELTADKIKLELQVDVLAYNSKVYYIVTDGGGYGEQVVRIPITGNERVLDAISQINGLPAVASKKKIWVARATPDHSPPVILPVDWCAIVQQGQGGTNYQIFPGDRVYVNSDHWIKTDSWLGKRLAPIERVFGTVLLSSSTVNSIKNGTTGNNGIGR